MGKTVQIVVKEVYGSKMVYPANDTAREFVKLTGKKTFSHADLIIIEKLGYVIEQAPQKLDIAF